MRKRLLIYATIFVVGIISQVCIARASEGEGCCQNPGGQCVPAFSNDGSGTPPQNSNRDACEAEETPSGRSFLWFEDVLCVPGNNCPGFVPPSPSPSPSPTPSASPSPTPSVSPSPSASPPSSPTPIPAPTATSIPTFSTWGLIITVVLILVAGFIVARRMRKI